MFVFSAAADNLVRPRGLAVPRMKTIGTCKDVKLSSSERPGWEPPERT